MIWYSRCRRWSPMVTTPGTIAGPDQLFASPNPCYIGRRDSRGIVAPARTFMIDDQSDFPVAQLIAESGHGQHILNAVNDTALCPRQNDADVRVSVGIQHH